MKFVDPEKLAVDTRVLVLMCDGPIGSGKITPTRWQTARITAVIRRKSKVHPHGHIKVDVLTERGGLACRDEIGLHELRKYVRQSNAFQGLPKPVIPKVDLLNASAQLFCETLFLAAKIGVTDAMAKLPSRGDHDLAALLCVREKYRYEHVRMLHEAYESGHTFMELQGQPTNMTWGTTTERSGRTEHGSYKVRVTKGNG